jgi:predicted MFS family arabinose efflux permease
MIAAVVPVAGLMFLVRTPTGVTTSRVPEEGTAKGLDWIVQTCLRSRHFWFIGASLLAVSIATMGAIASYVFLFADLHISSRTIAAILSISGLASLIGRMIVGYLLDRFFAPYVTACVFGFAAAGLAVLALAPSTPTAFVAASLIGIALGAEADILAFLVSRYFKVGDFSRVLGILWVAWAWGGAIGSVIMGKGYASTGSYTIPLAFLTFLIALGAIIICFIGPYRFPVHSVKKAGIEG